MRSKSQLIIGVAAVLIALAANIGTIAQKPKAEEKPVQGKLSILELAISQDGRSIVDQHGKVVAWFVEDLRVKMPAEDVKAESQTDAQTINKKMEAVKANSLKIQGCMRCKDECLIYDRDGRCIKTYRSCTWDFDCKP